MKYSEHLGEIREHSFQLALDKFDLGDFLSADAIPLGLFGQNVFLSSTRGEFVFRGLPRYTGQFETERYIAQRLHSETDVPVPWPYLVDESEEIFGWPYVIMPRMPGLQLENPEVQSKLSKQDRIDIAQAMGENLGCMHCIEHPYPGVYEPITKMVRPLEPTYVPFWKQDPEQQPIKSKLSAEDIFRHWIVSRINFSLNTALLSNDESKNRITTREDAEWIKSIIDDAGSSLLEPFQPCYVMTDYKEGNVAADKVDGQWKITGLFDLMEVYFGDGEADLSRTLAAYGTAGDNPDDRAVAFLKAYFKKRNTLTVRPGFTKRFVVYMLMDRISMWSYGRKIGWFDGIDDFRSWCEPQLTLSFNINELMGYGFTSRCGT